MHKSLHLILLMVTLACPSTRAQEQTDSVGEFFHLIDSAGQLHKPNRLKMLWRDMNNRLDERDACTHLSVDTSYMERIPQKLKLKFIFNESGSAIRVRGKLDGVKYKAKTRADNKQTLGVQVAYRGLALGASINPAHYSGKYKDYEFNTNEYSNRWGFDVIFQSANTYKGDIRLGDETSSVTEGMVKRNMLTVNAYYVFNYRKFSYPAAFTQSWIQKRNCGSFMLGCTFMGGNTRIAGDEELGFTASRHSIALFSAGGGYGYNFVVQRKWLIHMSVVPEMVLFNYGHITTEDSRERMKYRLLNFIQVGRLAVVRHFQKTFLGLSAVVNYSNIGDRDDMKDETVKWRARLFVGLKL